MCQQESPEPLTPAEYCSISNCMIGGLGKLKLKASDYLRFNFRTMRVAQIFLTHSTGWPGSADPGL